MYDSLLKYIYRYSSTPLANNEFELVKQAFSPKKLKRKQYFLQEGEVCWHSAFIVKGALRLYTVDDRDVEHTLQLAIENWWITDWESWVTLTPSIYNIDAWEDSEMLLITRAKGIELVQNFPAFNEMVRKMDENRAIAVQKRLTASISLSAEKRYADFLQQYPDLIQRFPQHIIASYLGIAKETLSRIRKQALQK